jgi:hypothetical protein
MRSDGYPKSRNWVAQQCNPDVRFHGSFGRFINTADTRLYTVTPNSFSHSVNRRNIYENAFLPEAIIISFFCDHLRV